MNSLKNKKTRIICTIGPASWDPKILKQMHRSGMNVTRVNGAFADLAELERVEKLIRNTSDDIALMLDIKGHEVRLNKFEKPIKIKPGDIIEIGSSQKHDIYPVTFPNLFKDLEVGNLLVFDDGNVEAVIRDITHDGVMKCETTFGELFKPGKSINTPGIHLSNATLTKRDKEQIEFCGQREWEFIAASFIRTSSDAKIVMRQVKKYETKVIAKIEDQEGVRNVDEIIEIVDGIMVARGDMGVEMPIERIPLVQKKIIYKCMKAGKPAITATNMLESMTEKHRPTRAEVTDVANAVIDGTDATMLSGETSSGKYPVESVTVMAKIAKEIETHLPAHLVDTDTNVPAMKDALAKSIFETANEIENLAAIIIVSDTGRLAGLVGQYGLSGPIYAFIPNNIRRRQLLLSRGITNGYVFPKSYNDRDGTVQAVLREIKEKKLAKRGQKILIVGHTSEDNDYVPNIFEVIEFS